MSLPRLSAQLPLPGVARPAYDRAALRAGIAHLGLGAFHRCHQAEYTDDLLALGEMDWGIIGINIRPPALEPALGLQDGLYTRLMLDGERVTPRVIGSLLRVVDSQTSPLPALAVLADPAIHVVTLTVTEKGYCHHPASGALNLEHPDIVHDIAHPADPHSLPGLLVRALDLRRATLAPLTLISCDNIPANGRLLKSVVMDLAARQSDALARWIDAACTFPGTMVDRIAPAATPRDRDWVAAHLGYDDAGVVVCEPFRQWVIEESAAGPFPGWDLVGATLVSDAEPFEIIKMRVLNGAQTTLAHLGALCGHATTWDDMQDPVLARLVSQMLRHETLPTLPPVAGLNPEAYLEQSLARLQNSAIRHLNHQIATDGSQKIVQRLLNPLRARRARGLEAPLLCVAVAGWMAYVLRAAPRFGAAWVADDPFAGQIAAMGTRIGDDPPALVTAILSLTAVFHPSLGADTLVVAHLSRALAGLLGPDPRGWLADLVAGLPEQLPEFETKGYSHPRGAS